MDLDNFDDVEELDQRPSVRDGDSLSSSEALKEMDRLWFAPATRRARWMDLLGDYAGTELFIISGESLLERVLDDPLLAIGRTRDTSFQLLHAYYILETTLLEFINRRSNFEIVFWQVDYHSTIRTGDPSFIVASRYLARSLLFEHLMKLDVVVHTFEGFEDPSWLRFQYLRRPMFVLTNDGGVADQSGFQVERTLLQRVILLRLIHGGMAIAALNNAEFRDSKVFSFIYHEAHQRRKIPLSGAVVRAVEQAQRSLDTELLKHHSAPPLSLRSLKGQLTKTLHMDRMVQFVERAVERLTCDFSSELLFVFLLHATILPELSLLERAQPCPVLNGDLLVLLLNSFLPQAFFLASPLPFDSIDGRVFASLISAFITHPSKDFLDVVGSIAYAEVQNIWGHLSLPIPDLSRFCARYGSAPPTMIPSRKRRKRRVSDQTVQTRVVTPSVRKLLPFNHPVLDCLLWPDTVENEQTPTSVAHLDFGIPFSDTRHWHNSTSILPSYLGGDDQHRVLDERQRRRAAKSNQRFMSNLQKSAATLTGALGATLQQMTIVSVKKLSKDSRVSKKHPTAAESRHSNKKEKNTLTSKQKLREEIEQKRTALRDDSSYKWWRDELDNMAQLSTDRKAERIEFLFRNKRSDEPMIGLEMRLYSLNLTLHQWIEDAEKDSQLVRDKFTLAIMKNVKTICDRKALTPSVAEAIKAVLVSLGFAAYTLSLLSDSVNLPDRGISFPFTKLMKNKEPRHKFMAITDDPFTWQLRVFGEFMDRSMDGAPDPRVSFKPDAWQREVLDCIDGNFSVLVIAPTSAGKTFISYYSMEKILRDSDDGILVYVAPTKALVTQITAEIYARFKKNLDSRSLWAIYTRDYRINDPLKCQILVTVPEILATLLLSPPLARVWTPRLKSIILDEIHTIGQQQGGSVWEEIILMAPCPIIGLSATIGAPQNFSQWLESVQTAHGFKYRAIEHPHRYSHLRKFYYLLDETEREFKGLNLHQETQRKRFLHPISLLSFGTRLMPEDLALEASDTLTLYQALAKHVPSCEDLDPQIFFGSQPGSALLVQKDIIRYESALKAKLTTLMKAPDGKEAAAIIGQLQDPKIRSRDDLDRLPSPENFKHNLIFLLSDLHVRGELPAILFNFDRTNCESLAQELLSTLKTAEKEWRKDSPVWKEKMKQWEAWTNRAKERERAMARVAKNRGNDDEAPETQGERTHSWESSFDPDDPSSQFSFTGTTSYSKSELAEEIERLRRWSNTAEWALEALQRGVGVHHAGMDKKYRSLVESLFRQGFIRVMIATGTLALGINAPAKTSVLCGDSVFLTALQYRQCSGRAGRRGFDLLGNVIFYGLPMERVQRLVLSRLPALGGNFPLTSSLSLRLMNLLNGSNNAEVAVQAVRSILSLPRISFTSDIGRDQVLHHMRFSIEYLRRSGLLDRDGKPMDLFSLAAHLYYHEPSNFALVALMKNGVLHAICGQEDTIAAKRDFMMVMAHLFGRRYISRSYASAENIAVARKSPSMVILPNLPDPVREVLRNHEQEILNIFTGYALACAAQLEAHPDVGQDSLVLPLSKTSFPRPESDSTSMFRTLLRGAAVPVVARSPFVANSGHTDSFSSVEELARTARNGLHLNNNAIPSLKHLTTTDGGHLVNAYLLDFYIHGQVDTLARANGIRRGDVWYLLQDFSLTLATIENSLKQLLMAAPDGPEADIPHSNDPAEAEMDEEDEELGTIEDPPDQRPAGVRESDWRLYTIASGVLRDFNEKFRAMWA
ncbi:hypothetical protein DFH07DRAFT_813783 [Mycena maculata]|uniref:P-loop containing nucleoside triphosphate hydrolase protein n=1 Tax=Mycena maculata TaxID=230809 RepID=A0AAD7NJ31_9AGAR|nr:hypothetical protein DFH07DRAFT_813783 [Mycena maculata]